jgi:cyclic di-GMP phosphodiesterase
MAIVPGIEHLVASLREKDLSVVRHSERAARYALCIGQAMGLKNAQLFSLRRGGILHDLGKLSVPQSILDKPGPLTADEWGVVRQHPQEGHRHLLDRIEPPALDIVLYHHERFDGRGYPARINGEDIPILARVFAIADAFDAMTSERTVRLPMPLGDAREEILLCAGTQFDPVLVEVFAEVFDEIVMAHGEGDARLQPLPNDTEQFVVVPEVVPIRRM